LTGGRFEFLKFWTSRIPALFQGGEREGVRRRKREKMRRKRKQKWRGSQSRWCRKWKLTMGGWNKTCWTEIMNGWKGWKM
jgi:hypothetical protein